MLTHTNELIVIIIVPLVELNSVLHTQIYRQIVLQPYMSFSQKSLNIKLVLQR